MKACLLFGLFLVIAYSDARYQFNDHGHNGHGHHDHDGHDHHGHNGHDHHGHNGATIITTIMSISKTKAITLFHIYILVNLIFNMERGSTLIRSN
ncbi:hypothetical protein GJ496_002554 [Pomphorhynchus laevis]|nr:hypothetical protein GJ496_002554 [Pomphorhynchus laevis]